MLKREREGERERETERERDRERDRERERETERETERERERQRERQREVCNNFLAQSMHMILIKAFVLHKTRIGTHFILNHHMLPKALIPKT